MGDADKAQRHSTHSPVHSPPSPDPSPHSPDPSPHSLESLASPPLRPSQSFVSISSQSPFAQTSPHTLSTSPDVIGHTPLTNSDFVSTPSATQYQSVTPHQSVTPP
eukprot:GHVN01007784.1.p1 GENE.GHVN01007784.1~~GHVN01007784.1.p1  ORF type:complete len:106 (-),score=48.35 GHVN01007784.1:172-489(-)